MDITIIMTIYVQWSVSHELFIHSKIISKKYQEDIYSRNKGILIIEKLIFNLLFKLIHIFILIRKLASEEKSSLDELKDCGCWIFCFMSCSSLNMKEVELSD